MDQGYILHLKRYEDRLQDHLRLYLDRLLMAPGGKKKSLLDGASLRERMVLTNVKNYSKLGEKLNLFKHIYGRFYGC